MKYGEIEISDAQSLVLSVIAIVLLFILSATMKRGI